MEEDPLTDPEEPTKPPPATGTSSSGKKYDLSSLKNKKPETPAPILDRETLLLDQRIASTIAMIEADTVPLDSNFISNLPGNWKIVPRGDIIKQIVDKGSKSVRPRDIRNLSEELVQREIKKSIERALSKYAGASPFGEIINDNGDRIRIFAKARRAKGKPPAPVADNSDIKIATESIADVNKAINSRRPALLSLIGPSTRIPGRLNETNDKTAWGFVFDGAIVGAHIYVERIKNSPPTEGGSKPYNPETSFHSVPSNNFVDRYRHTILHELGHNIAHEAAGIEATLKIQYKEFGLEGQKISKYGKKNAHEHFAESFSRYVMTGDATPEFLSFLKSKNLLKSQENSTQVEGLLLPDISDLDAPTIRFVKGPPRPDNPKAAVGSSKDAKEKVLSALLDKVKSGEAPWRKPFKDGFNFAGAFVPRNPASKRVYSGLNSLVLKLHQQLEGYEDPRWMTYNQAQSLGGQVRKGEKGTPILVPFKRVKKEKDSATGEEKVTGGYVSFSAKTVFNVAQIDGLDLPDLKTEAGEPKTPLEAQNFIIDRYKKSMEAKGLKTPEISYTYVGEYGSHDSSPNWRPSSDAITLPTKEQFNSPEDMFDTMAHELAHSTGHPTRLDRSELTRNYSTDNASRGKEELIAEIAAAILASMFGVNSDFDNTAAYVKSWLKALQDNPEMIIGASSDAQKVVDYLLGMDLGDWSPIEGYSTAARSDKDEE